MPIRINGNAQYYANNSAIDWASLANSLYTLPELPTYPDPPPTIREPDRLEFRIQGRREHSPTLFESVTRLLIEPERRRYSPNVGTGTIFTMQRLSGMGGSMYVVMTPEQVLELARTLHRHGAVAVSESQSASTATE